MLETIEHGAIRELRFARPPVNALDPQLLGVLLRALEKGIDERVAALILSGQPGMFSAGLDIPALLRLDRDQLRQFWPLFFGVQGRIASSPIPVIAAITGHCPAGGTVLALYCDHRVMARGAFRIGLNEVQVGLFAGPIIHRAFERLVGTRHAAELLTRGALVSPEEAHGVGLVDEIVEPAEVVPRAFAYARDVAALPQGAYARTRALVRADLVALFTATAASFVDEANDAWFDPETQRRLRELFSQRASST
ncbi:MAG: enoyl-CoA hydratase/isomerase family protein [Steroidobacteraceae bacterium]